MCSNTLVTIHFIKSRLTLKVTGDDTVIEGEHLTLSQETHWVNLIFLHFLRRLRGIREKFLKVGLSHLKALQRPHWASCENWNTAWRTAIKWQVGEYESWWIIRNSSTQRVSSYLLCSHHLSPSFFCSSHSAYTLTADSCRDQAGAMESIIPVHCATRPDWSMIVLIITATQPPPAHCWSRTAWGHRSRLRSPIKSPLPNLFTHKNPSGSTLLCLHEVTF